MKILVTGATGFLGSHIVRRLVRDGHTVRILRRASSLLADLQGLPFEDVIGDITQSESAARAMADVDAVIHAAAKISYWPRDAAETVHVNSYGTFCVANAALKAGVKRFIYVSSVVTVGIPDLGRPGNEDDIYRLCKNPYTEGKFGGEALLGHVIEKGLPAVIVNPGAIIGPVDRRRAVGGLFFPGRINQYFYIPGGMSVVDVEDVVDGIVRAMEKGCVGERYLLTGENISYRRMREVIAEEMGEPKPFIPVPMWLLRLMARFSDAISLITGRRPRVSLPMAKFLPLELYYSSRKAQDELGWTHRPFRDSVKRAAAWYKSVTR